VSLNVSLFVSICFSLYLYLSLLGMKWLQQDFEVEADASRIFVGQKNKSGST
jgi:hypothetical protein